MSKEIIAEVQDVLTRPRVRQKFLALTDELVGRFLMALEKRAVLIPEVPRAFAYQRDPKDEPYINLAIAAGASYLVCWYADLLDLAQPSDLEGDRLRRHTPHLRILDPVSFLAETRYRLQGHP